jgi:16S rRNA (cytidine1402-2'-O)-methyltransferase
LSGQLVLVATPIGNLGDISARSLEALRMADVIACEDTRRTGGLLHHFGIPHGRMVVVNEHTEVDRIPELIALVAGGSTVALVSDAGTPGISDPGERLVRAAVHAGHTVGAVPGPAALIMAVVLSGCSTRRFAFDGFLPRSGGERTQRLAELAGERRTVVLYEAPHRVVRTVADLAAACGGERRVALCRELTKMHEDVWRGTLAEAIGHTTSVDPLGEYVLVLDGSPDDAPPDDDAIRDALIDRFGRGMTTKSAVADVTATFRVPKRTVYALALELNRR